MEQYQLIEALGLDLGGTMSKLALYVPTVERFPQPELARLVHRTLSQWRASSSLAFVHRDLDLALTTRTGRLRFCRFPSSDMAKFVDALGELKALGDRAGLNFGSRMTCVTGGGAHKYRQLFEQIGVSLQPRDEMDALVGGFRYMMNNYSRLSYTAATAKVKPPAAQSDGDPNTFVLANIGSGVSILLCTPTECTRVTGSSIGGSTFLGLVRRMTSYASFDDAVAGAASGDRTTTSMLVSDIYGSDYDRLGLAGSLVASDFGKLATAKDPKAAALDADIARGAMVLVLNNVAQLAVMTAQKHGASRIFFVGGMLRPGLMEELVTTGVEFWSGGKEAAHFLRHTAYLGTLGSLLANRVLSKELMLTLAAK